MLKLAVNDMGEEVPVEIVENDRGDWEVLPYVGETGCIHLVGFGGENVLSIHFMPMQDGTCSVVVVHSCCDNPIRVVQGLAARRAVPDASGYSQMEGLTNDLIAQVCDYPETLEDCYERMGLER